MLIRIRRKLPNGHSHGSLGFIGFRDIVSFSISLHFHLLFSFFTSPFFSHGYFFQIRRRLQSLKNPRQGEDFSRLQHFLAGTPFPSLTFSLNRFNCVFGWIYALLSHWLGTLVLILKNFGFYKPLFLHCYIFPFLFLV